MKKILSTLPVLIAVLTLGSCSERLTPFTDRLRNDNGWGEPELKQIQYYLSKDLILRREIADGDTHIVSGKIKMVGGRKVEEILIPARTPGLLTFMPDQKRMAVSFEEGGKDRFLMFGPNPNANERYTLMGKAWDKRSGTVTYDGVEYKASIEYGIPALLVDLRVINRTDRNQRTAKGRRIK